MASIPAHLHFVWIGKSLPFFVQLAMRSALSSCPDAKLTLWHTDALPDAALGPLIAHPRFARAPLDEAALFDGADGSLPIDLLARLFAGLKQPAARANLARLLLLARHGGVYLDTDTLTLRDLAPLLSLGGFCGLEHVIWPLTLRYAVSPYRVVGGPLRGLVRNACARLPEGERLFAHAARFYHQAANNAVLGFHAGHPFLLDMLRRVSELPPDMLTRRYRLGTHLLQESLVSAEGTVHTLPPAAFYPLGPEISRQYFAPRSDAQAAADRIVGPSTYLVHWYASVSELVGYDEARIRGERERTVFAQLAARALDRELTR